jgi:hypothetical protein
MADEKDCQGGSIQVCREQMYREMAYRVYHVYSTRRRTHSLASSFLYYETFFNRFCYWKKFLTNMAAGSLFGRLSRRKPAKKQDPDSDPDPNTLVRDTNLRIRIRTKMLQIRNTGSKFWAASFKNTYSLPNSSADGLLVHKPVSKNAGSQLLFFGGPAREYNIQQSKTISAVPWRIFSSNKSHDLVPLYKKCPVPH